MEQWSLGDPLRRADALAGVDAFCHLAAFIPPALSDPVYADECFRTPCAKMICSIPPIGQPFI